ncbi:hypothetical protein C0J52_02192, partial [Blattella germanica]
YINRNCKNQHIYIIYIIIQKHYFETFRKSGRKLLAKRLRRVCAVVEASVATWHSL